jgi:raffinose/stachyose/melibiose transport system permease protein
MYPFGKGIKRYLPLLLLMIPLSLYVVFYFGPSMMTVIYSFTDITNVPGSKLNFVGLENYYSVFNSGNSGERWDSIIRTVYFMIIVTIVQNGVGLLMAVVINQKLKGDYFYRAVFFLPVVLGVSVVALVWGLMFDPLSGPVNQLYD